MYSIDQHMISTSIYIGAMIPCIAETVSKQKGFVEKIEFRLVRWSSAASGDTIHATYNGNPLRGNISGKS